MGVAFIDVGIYVTSLRTLKNLLLVGDVVKSVMFVAFQVRNCRFLTFHPPPSVRFRVLRSTRLFAFASLVLRRGWWRTTTCLTWSIHPTTPPGRLDRLPCGGGGLFGSVYFYCALTRGCGVVVCSV